MINDEIDKLRHSQPLSLAERRDVIMVGVGVFISLGSPEEYLKVMPSLRQGALMSRDEVILKLVQMQYERNDIEFVRNKFRVRGDVVEIFHLTHQIRLARELSFWGRTDRICEIHTH